LPVQLNNQAFCEGKWLCFLIEFTQEHAVLDLANSIMGFVKITRWVARDAGGYPNQRNLEGFVKIRATFFAEDSLMARFVTKLYSWPYDRRKKALRAILNSV
jgi:hypothetical protein